MPALRRSRRPPVAARGTRFAPLVARLEDRALLDGAAATQQLQVAYGQLPLSFEVNQGQADPQVNFLARGSGYALFLTADEAVLSLQPPAAAVPSTGQSGAAPALAAAATSPAVVRMRLLGANPAPQVVGQDQQPGVSNYFLGNDPAQWHTAIAHYGRIVYREVYPGVDLSFYGNQQHLEYDFTVAPGADPQSIALAFKGALGMTLDAQGDLVLQTASGAVVEQAPVMYQEIGGVKTSVAGSYVLEGDGRVGFRVGAYDPGRPLVVDPVLVYSTYLGGNSGPSWGFGIAVDSSGSAYVTGFTLAYDFPTQHPLQPTASGDLVAFVAKLAPNGASLVYSTFLGGSGDGRAIAVDAQGNAYVTGQTSADFPMRGPHPPQSSYGGAGDAFVAKIAPDGESLIYSTFLGGDGEDIGTGIAVDAQGNAYVTGWTDSANFPTQNPLQPAYGGGRDAFVAKLAPDGASLVYSTFLGGSGRDEGNGIAVDAHGDAYVTGRTKSTDFPTQQPLQPASGGSFDAFVTELAPDGKSLIDSTYVGGNGDDNGLGIAVDSAGSAYVTGWTESDNFPTQNPLLPTQSASRDGFVAKLAPDGKSLVYSTYLPGGVGSAIALDVTGHAYLAGGINGGSIPTPTPPQPTFGGGVEDAFVAELALDGKSLVYSTYLGGSDLDEASGIALDSVGNAYVTGGTESNNFPTKNPIQTLQGGDAFVAKISAAGTPTTTTTPTPTSPTRTPAPTPTFLGELRLTAGTGRKKKVVGFELRFSSPLDAAVAQWPSHYRVTQPGRSRHRAAKVIKVGSIGLGRDDRSVTLVLGKYDARKPLTLTAAGLVGADGTPTTEIITNL
jgi:hypothetical protein